MKTTHLGAVLLAIGALAACGDDEGSAATGGGAGAGGSSIQSTGSTPSSSGPGGEGGGDGSGGDGQGSTTTSVATGTTSVGVGTGGSGGGADVSSLEGYWVWTRQIENAAVTLEITDVDMEPRVGPSGWEGCPEGILCTHYGIHKVAFGESGRLHQQHNVFTSSDFQTLGTWADGSDGAGTFQRQEQYSCAHPEQVNADVVDGTFRYRLEGGELWIAVSGFFGFAYTDPGPEPTTWLVYKPVSHDEYYGKYMIRVCQPFDEFQCHAACSDASLVDEP